jgi:hypothetical protein
MKNRILYLLSAALIVSGVSCKKDDPVTSPTTTPTTPASLSISSPYQVNFTLDGTAMDYNIGTTTGFDMVNSANNSVQPIGGGTSTFIYGSSIGNGTAYVGFMKGTFSLPGGGLMSDSEFLSMFPAATVAYSPASANGVVVSYFDGSTLWSSDLGTADQTGSAFKIEANQVLTGGSYYTVKLYITFNCKVYDGSGGSKTITNGSFIINVAKI